MPLTLNRSLGEKLQFISDRGEGYILVEIELRAIFVIQRKVVFGAWLDQGLSISAKRTAVPDDQPATESSDVTYEARIGESIVVQGGQDLGDRTITVKFFSLREGVDDVDAGPGSRSAARVSALQKVDRALNFLAAEASGDLEREEIQRIIRQVMRWGQSSFLAKVWIDAPRDIRVLRAELDEREAGDDHWHGGEPERPPGDLAGAAV